MKEYSAFENVTVEAASIWSMFDNLIGDDWKPLASYGHSIAPLARWMPLPSWRPLFHELGQHRLLAHRVNKGVIEISRWGNRCPLPASDIALSPQLRTNLLFHYTDWTKFSWDWWQDLLLDSGIETEALWQLNSIYIACHAKLLLESKENGSKVRATQDLVIWANNN